jgi:ribulose-phosphate 3-epimerase
MVTPVDALAQAFCQSGADRVSVHVDAAVHVDRTLQLIRDCGALAGLAFDPATPLGALEWVIDKVDLILVMGVNPGFAGQRFEASALRKLESARRIIDASGRAIRLEVDGGVTVANIRSMADAGADTFVSGSAIFGSTNCRTAIDAMRTALGDPLEQIRAHVDRTS